MEHQDIANFHVIARGAVELHCPMVRQENEITTVISGKVYAALHDGMRTLVDGGYFTSAAEIREAARELGHFVRDTLQGSGEASEQAAIQAIGKNVAARCGKQASASL